MKEGTGGDPFADDPVNTDDTPSEAATETAAAETGTDPTNAEMQPSRPDTDDGSRNSLPYIYQRETVKEDRDQVPFFLRDHVQKLEDEFIEELEDRLDTNVYKADAREVALEIAFETRVDEAVDRLRDWGYDR